MESVQNHVLTAMCRKIGTPRALTVFLLLKNGEWDQLVSLECDPKHYFDADSYRKDASVTDFLRKADFLPTSFDRQKAAQDNFILAEKQCGATNLRLAPFLSNILDEDYQEAHYRFISVLRKKVKWLLGPLPSEDELSGKFGPGSTFSDKGDRNLILDKLSSVPTLTTGAVGFLPVWSKTHWGRNISAFERLHDLDCIRGNRFTTVPKDAKKDRGIAVEPSINVFFQLSIGSWLKRRMRFIGHDMERAQDVHRVLAQSASKLGHLSTIDLSNASDTVATNFVKLVVPEQWFQLLSSLRSPHTFFKGKWHRLEKFSSMGNGFTFELETVLFLGISLACLEVSGITARIGENVSCYGDDIIVPTECSPIVISCLKFFGFTPNDRKTFTSGLFRESCGGDFFDGQYVRSYFLKELPDAPEKIISMANGIRRVATENNRYDCLDPCYLHSWFRCLDAIPSHLRLYGPITLGDLVIHEEPRKWKRRTRSSIHYIKVYRPARYRKVSLDRWDGDTVYASATYGISTVNSRRSIDKTSSERLLSDWVIPRDSVLGHKVGWVPFS